MRALPAGDYLVEFASDDDARSGNKDRSANPSAAKLSREMAAKIEEAHARGFESGKAAADLAFETRLEAQRAELTQQFAFERQEWADQEASKLADALTSGLHDVRVQIAEAATRILVPFLAEELRRKAIEALYDTLDRLIAKDEAVQLSISGPADILHELRRRLEGRSLAVSYHPNQDCEVRITAGRTIVETALSSWMTQIRELAA
jgi:hypothetical protein